MFTEKQQEIADCILKDLSAQNFTWESDYMSELHSQFESNYHDCGYVLQSLISDFKLVERYNNGFLKLTADGMKAAEKKFMKTVKSEQRHKMVKKWTDYFTFLNALLVLIGSALTLIVQWLLKVF